MYIWSLSSLLKLLGRSSRVRRSLLYWYLSDPRRMTLSDQHPWTLICSNIYYGAFPRAFFSSDALSLKNGTLSPAQRLKFWPPQFLLFLIYFSNILKYDVNIYLSFLLNYCRINGWEFCCKWDSPISSNELFWLKWITSRMYTILFFIFYFLFIVYISFIIEYDVDFFFLILVTT